MNNTNKNIYLFLDTNVYLHFTPFYKYPWKEHFPERYNIQIVITNPIIDEIEKCKYHGNIEIRKRAANIIKKIDRAISEKSIDGIEYIFFSEVISSKYIEDNDLDPQNGDDRILSSILKFIERNNTTNYIIFVSNDLGPRLKATRFGIISKTPIEDQKLKIQDDGLEKKIKQLQFEILKLKSLQPKLDLVFNNGSKFMNFEIESFHAKTSHYYNEKCSKNRFDLPLYSELNEEVEKHSESPPIDPERFFASFRNFHSNWITAEEKGKYDSELLIYRKYFEEYLHKVTDFERFKALTIELQIKLMNSGTIPAEDIDIELYIPDGIEIFSESDYPSWPEEPIPPIKPRGPLEFNYSFNSILSPSMPRIDFGNTNLNVSTPEIKKTNSYNVSLHVSKIKHNSIVDLYPIYAVFSNYDSIINFEVTYNLKCANLPEIIYGKISIICKLKNN